VETKLTFYGQDYQRHSPIALQENSVELRRNVWQRQEVHRPFSGKSINLLSLEKEIQEK